MEKNTKKMWRVNKRVSTNVVDDAESAERILCNIYIKTVECTRHPFHTHQPISSIQNQHKPKKIIIKISKNPNQMRDLSIRLFLSGNFK